MSSCNGLYRPSRSASLPLSLPFFFPGYSASVPSAFASVSALSRSAPFPSAHPFGLASVSQLSTFRFLAAAFFFHSFELLFSAFRLSLFRASSRLRFLPFRAFPRSFGLLLTYSYLFPFGLSFRSCLRSGFSSTLSSFFSACLLFCSFELLFRPAVSLLFRAYLRFRFFGFGIPFVLPLPLSVLLPFSQLSAFASCCGFLFPLFRASFFCLPSLFPFGLPYGPGFFPFGLSRRSFGLCPPLFPFSFRSAFRLRFRFWLSASASCPGLLLFRAFCPAFFSVLSNFFSGLPSFHSFKLPYGLGFRVLFRIFSNPENDTDETLTTSGVSHGDF